MDTEDYHESVPVTARGTSEAQTSDNHQYPWDNAYYLATKMQVESAHAQHAVALSTRRMRSNKIEFLPDEDEFKRKKTARKTKK